jgi:hypothetical protein
MNPSDQYIYYFSFHIYPRTGVIPLLVPESQGRFMDGWLSASIDPTMRIN